MASKTVQPIAIELGIKGGEKLAALNRSFRDLSKQVKLSDADITQATKDIAKFATEAGNSEATIKGQIKAFEGLREQAAMGGKAYTELTQGISKLQSTLRGSSDAVERERLNLVKLGSASKNSAKDLQYVIGQLEKLKSKVREDSAAFLQLGKDIKNLNVNLKEVEISAGKARFAINTILSAKPEKITGQIEKLNAAIASGTLEAEDLNIALRKLELLKVGAGRGPVAFRADVFSSRLGVDYFARLRKEYDNLEKTQAAISQRISEVNTELQNVSGYERRRSLTLELIRLNKELQQSIVNVTTREQFQAMAIRLRAMAIRQRMGSARESYAASGFGAFSAEIRQRTAGGEFTPGMQRARERAEGRARERRELEQIAQLQQEINRLEGEYVDSVRSALQTIQDYEQKRHDDFMRQVDERQAAEDRASAQAIENIKREGQAERDQFNTLLQQQKAAASAMGIGGRTDISPLYEGIIGLSTADIRRQQQMMGKSATEVFNDIATSFGKGGQAVDLKQKSTSIGGSIAEGVVDGASDSSEIDSGAKTFAQRLIAAYKAAFGIRSPSKETEQKIGIPLGLGIIRGLLSALRSGKKEVQQEIESIAEPLIPRSRQPRRLIGTVNEDIATFTGYGTRPRPAMPGYRPLPKAAQSLDTEIDRMFNQFRVNIAAVTTDAEIYYNLLQSLPTSRITTDLAAIASRRARAAEIPGFMQTQRQIGPGDLEREIASSVAGYMKELRTPNPWVGPIGDYQKFIDSVSKKTEELIRLREYLEKFTLSDQKLLSGTRIAGALPPSRIGFAADESRLANILGLGATKALPPARRRFGELQRPDIAMFEPEGTAREYQKMARLLAEASSDLAAAKRFIDDVGFQNLPVGVTGLSGVALTNALMGYSRQRRGLTGGGYPELRGIFPGADTSFRGGVAPGRFSFGGQELLPVSGPQLALPSAEMRSLERELEFEFRKLRAKVRGGSEDDRRFSFGGQEVLPPPQLALPSAEMRQFAREVELELRELKAKIRGGSEGEHFMEAGRGGGRYQGGFLGGGGGGGGGRGGAADAGAAGGAFNKLIQDLKEFGPLSDRSAADIRELGASLGSLQDIISPLDADFEQVNKAIAKQSRLIDRELEKREKQRSRRRGMSPMQMTQAAGAAISGGIFGGPEGFLGGAIGAIGGVGTAFAGAAIGAQVGGFRKLIGEFADYSAKIEKLKISLKGIAGSQEEYSRALAAAAGATEKLNIPQEVAIQGITRLTAAVKGAGGGVADAELAFNSINSAIVATGGGAEQVEGAITALVQIFSKGKVSAEEINQIAERLPGTFNKIAEASGRTGTELANALQAGTVGLNDLQKFLISLGDEYGDLAKQIANSSQSAGERLARSFDNLRENVGKALQPVGADFQDAFNEFLKEITPGLIESSKAVASLLKVILESKDVILPVVELTAKILALKLAISGLSALKAGVAGFFAASASGAKITGDAMVGLQAKVSGLTVVVKRLAVAFAGLAAFDYLFKAFASGQELETLRKRAESGAAGTELTYKSRAEIIEAQNEAQKEFIELLKEEERIKEKMGNANIFSVWFGSLGRSASELEKVKLKQESLLDIFGVQVPDGDELSDYKSPEQIKNEKEQRAQSLLNAIEQRENAIAQARIQLEEQAANIRKQAIEQAKQLEERFANQRLQKERELQDLRRQLAYVEEDIAFGAEEAKAVAAGADPEIFAARRQIIEFSRQQKEEEIALDRQLLDEQTENTKALEEFKINNAKAINEANEAYAKQIGRIQQEYARSVAKIIEEGTGRAGERLELAGVIIANQITQAEAQATALRLGYSFKRGGGISGDPDYDSVLNEFGQNSLAAARQAFVNAEQAIDRAYNSLADIPTATAIAAPAITSIGDVTADLDRKAIALAKNLDAARAQIRGISKDLADEEFLEKVSSAFRGTGAGIFAQQRSLASQQSQQRRVLRLREEGFSDEVAGQLVKQEDLVASQRRILEAQFEEAKKERPQLKERLTKDFEKTKENIDASSNSIREFIAALDNIPTEIKLRTAVVDAKQQLRDLVDTSNQVKGAATAIGDAFSQSFVDAISGSKTAKEALADFFSSVGSYFLDMAKQIIAKMIQIAILNSVAKLLPSTSLTTSAGVSMSAGTATQSGFDMGSALAGMFKANGGPVNANQPYIVGERGPELFVPFQQGSITSNEAMRQASMAQLPFTRNAESISQATQTAQAMQAAGPINVKYESTVINGVEYVSAEQHRKGMAEAAERGRALTLQTLQNSVRTRSKVGL